MRMVLSWGQLIYIFFPIPIFCLALLSLAWPRSLERAGSRLVSKIFFTEIRAGPVHVKLLYFFVAVSLLVFAGTVRTLKAAPTPCKTCVYAGETLWYGKAMKFRAERNFWLSLFNLILWMLVWVVHHDRQKMLSLKDRVSELESEAMMEGGAEAAPEEKEEPVPSDEVRATSSKRKKNDISSEEVVEKSDEAKKAD